MRKFKKVCALACTSMMLAASVLPVSADNTSQGQGGIEVDNSTVLEMDNMVLPTLSAGQYAFTVDVSGLLDDYNPDLYASGKSVYFKSETGDSKLSVKSPAAGTTYAFYQDSYTANDAASKLTALLVTPGNIAAANIGDTLNHVWYVWQPAVNDEGIATGYGDYVEITQTNYEKFFTVTVDGSGIITGLTVDTTPKAGALADIWDGSIYQKGYTAVASEAAAADLYEDNNMAVPGNLYVTASDDPSTYLKAVTATAQSGEIEVEYTPATTLYNDTTPVYKIINKCTYDVAVEANVKISETYDWISFVNSFAAEHDTAAMTFTITDGTNNKAVVDTTDTKVAEASAYYVIKAALGDDIVYQDGDNVDPTTGSHIYKSYLKNVTSFDSAKFKFVATADTAAATAWAAYAAALEENDGTAARPTIDVVYKFTKVTTSETGDDAGKVYTAADGATYTTTNANATEWATFAAGNGSADAGDDGVVVGISSTDSYVYDGEGAFAFEYDKENPAITAVTDVVINTSTGGTGSLNGGFGFPKVLDGHVTIDPDAGTVTLSETVMGLFGGGDGSDVIFVIFDDNTSLTDGATFATINITVTPAGN